MGNKLLVFFLLLTIASFSTSFIITQRIRNQPQTYYACSWFGIDCPVTKIAEPRMEDPRIEGPRFEGPRSRDPNLRYHMIRFF